MKNAIVTTEAVVLRSMKYLETSKIVTFYSRRYGKIATIVKGARRSPGKYGASLEPMSYDSIVVYRKEGRELQTLAQCSLLKSFRRLYEDLGRMAVGMTIIELVSIVAHEEEENAPLFDLIVESLDGVDRLDGNPSNLLYRFIVRLASILGFHPTFDRCIACGSPIPGPGDPEAERRFHLSGGGPLCSSCPDAAGKSVSIQAEALLALHSLAWSPDVAVAAVSDIASRHREQIEGLLWAYLRFHVSGMRMLKSGRVFSRIL